MAGNRWKRLDFEPSAQKVGKDELSREAGRPASEPSDAQRLPYPKSDQPPPEVKLASGAYALRNYALVVELLEPRLALEPALAGGQRVLGQALARLGREEEAAERLAEAARQAATDWLTRASLASLLLRHPDPARAASLEPLMVQAHAAAPAGSQSALWELGGAGRWSSAQAALVAGRSREAARQFAASSEQFTAAARVSGAARQALPERQAAAFVGEAVALLLADELAAAQRLFSGKDTPPAGSADPLIRFAAGLFQLCEELAVLTPSERAGVAVELRQVVLDTRLEVGFYDGRRAVSLAWVSGAP